MKQYSLDFRRRVLAYKQKHMLIFEKTSQHFEISLSSLFRWFQKIEPCTTRNKPATKVDMQKLSKDVEDYPDAYQRERAQRIEIHDLLCIKKAQYHL